MIRGAAAAAAGCIPSLTYFFRVERADEGEGLNEYICVCVPGDDERKGSTHCEAIVVSSSYIGVARGEGDRVGLPEASAATIRPGHEKESAVGRSLGALGDHRRPSAAD